MWWDGAARRFQITGRTLSDRLVKTRIATLFPPFAGDALRGEAWQLFTVRGPGDRNAVVALGTVETSHLPQNRKLAMRIVEISPWSTKPATLMKNAALFDGRTLRLTADFVSVSKDWQGCGIGTLGLNALVTWAKTLSGDAAVASLLIGSSAPRTKLEHFYGRFGFRWDRSDPRLDPDRSLPMTIAELHCGSAAPNSIVPVDLPEALHRYLKVDDQAERTARSNRHGIREEIDRQRRTRRIWAIGSVLLLCAMFCAGTFIGITLATSSNAAQPRQR